MDKDMRRIVAFPCEGATLLGTLDEGAATTGILIVSGGNEIRIGAHRGMAQLARDLAARGYPVFRFDRRGVGDSEGENGGFESSGPDIHAALVAFKAACPHLTRLVAFGNCDAATALWLHQPLAVDALVLANPWLIEASAEVPAPATARAYYIRRLRDPRAWAGLFKGAVNLTKMFGSLRVAVQRDEPSSLAARVANQIALFPIDTDILLAERDGTAVAFKAQWDGALFETYRPHIPITSLQSGSHSFANEADYDALVRVLTKALAA
jgi:exosortase A-associated hydrolase 1